MGCKISKHDDQYITLSQARMLSQLDHQVLIDANGTERDGKSTLEQATAYRHVIGRMLFVGRMSASLMLLHASMAASKIADLQRHHLRALETTLKRLKTEPAEIHFLSPDGPSVDHLVIHIISDGAMALADETKGRGCHINFRRSGQIVHQIQWCSRKLRRVSRSSATEEVLAAAESMSNGL